MQLADITPSIERMSDSELANFIFKIRERREHTRPVMKRKIKKATAKKSQKKLKGVEKLISQLSPAELELLLKEAQK